MFSDILNGFSGVSAIDNLWSICLGFNIFISVSYVYFLFGIFKDFCVISSGTLSTITFIANILFSKELCSLALERAPEFF